MRKKLNAYLEINHSFAQKVLVDWLFSKFRNLVLTKPKWRKGNGKREAYRFATQSLSVWFMDDGSKSHSSVYINTQQFSTNEQIYLIDLLKSQFNIDSTLNKDKEYFRIRIRTGSIQKFIKSVERFVLPELKYKLPFVMTL